MARRSFFVAKELDHERFRRQMSSYHRREVVAWTKAAGVLVSAVAFAALVRLTAIHFSAQHAFCVPPAC